MSALAVSGEVIDASGVAQQIEALLPNGVRQRQLTVRTLRPGCAWPPPITGPPTSPGCTRP